MSSSICHMLISLLLFVFLQHTLAIKQSYIVYLGSHSFGSNPSLLDSESVTNSHYDLLGSYLGSTKKAEEAIFYSYNKYINGFAAILEEDEATKIAKDPNVVSMFLNKRYELHTTRSWNFLGLETGSGFANDSAWKKSLGEDIIIGNLDTGVWPESKSFSDEGYGPIPKKWKGICQVAKGNPDKFYCNRKLIGAKYFYKGYQAEPGVANVTFNSARDLNGHGTHTLSTAGGNFVAGANVLGFGNGTASGGSPKARVAAYKVCWEGCSEADILAGFEAAIGDGVDVLSVSLGGDFAVEFFSSGLSIGSFHAIANNITVVTSGGNSGPHKAPVVNVEPWTITVAASTIDRDFANYVILGNNKTYKGASLSELNLPPNKFYPLILGADAMFDDKTYLIDNAMRCKEGSLDPKKVKGKILVCLRGVTARVDKGVQASRVGAVGMILDNSDQKYEVIADPHVLPATHVADKYGNLIGNYIMETKSPVASITKVETQLDIKNTPMMASFSSRGPNPLDRSILKPDITAPGVL
ncbi:unnamed protein product [Lathyrus oleraceus]|uniref:Uncharacterized protein n=1 Tax=Pisum sativum TaxID=3888 RepID=A0A9D5ARX4_PEA|nr:hypothetical protein KIW84_041945 [Pisum sativum]